MKKQLFIHSLSVVLIIGTMACGSTAKKTENQNTDSVIQKTKSVDSTKNEITTPTDVRFKVKELTKVKNQDQRYGSDSESMVELYINNIKVDEYKEYGDGDLLENGKQANLNSEISERIYTIPFENETTVKINLMIIFEGEEKDQWTKTYTKINAGKWELNNCKGYCD